MARAADCFTIDEYLVSEAATVLCYYVDFFNPLRLCGGPSPADIHIRLITLSLRSTEFRNPFIRRSTRREGRIISAGPRPPPPSTSTCGFLPVLACAGCAGAGESVLPVARESEHVPESISTLMAVLGLCVYRPTVLSHLVLRHILVWTRCSFHIVIGCLYALEALSSQCPPSSHSNTFSQFCRALARQTHLRRLHSSLKVQNIG